ARLARLFLGKPVHVAVDLPARREDDRQILLGAQLEDVERHDGVLERAVWLADELVPLRVRSQVHHEIDLGVLDATDSSGEGRVVPGEVLEEVLEVVRPGVETLVDAEHVMPASLQPLRQVRPDLAARACDEDAHQAATLAAWTPRRVVDVASPIRTSTSSPGSASPEKFTVVLRRVRPRRSVGSVRLGASTSTCSTRPTRCAFRPAAVRCTTSTNRSIRSRFRSSGI